MGLREEGVGGSGLLGQNKEGLGPGLPGLRKEGLGALKGKGLWEVGGGTA